MAKKFVTKHENGEPFPEAPISEDDFQNAYDEPFFPAETGELPWTDEYSEGFEDLDSMMEITAYSPFDDEYKPYDESIEITATSAAQDQKGREDEQKRTPLAETPADFSQGKTFKLPCSNKQLEEMMREVGIDGINEDAVKVKITNAVCPALCGIEVDNPNFRELNFLAKQLKQMSPEELKSFNKIITYERQLNPELSPADVINLSYNLDNYKIYDVSNAKTVEERFQSLGKQLKCNDRFEGETDKAYNERMRTNGEGFSKAQVLDRPIGTFTENAFVTKLNDNKEVYKTPDDISKLSGVFAAIKSSLKLS